jgi:hypothetical protein
MVLARLRRRLKSQEKNLLLIFVYLRLLWSLCLPFPLHHEHFRTLPFSDSPDSPRISRIISPPSPSRASIEVQFFFSFLSSLPFPFFSYSMPVFFLVIPLPPSSPRSIPSPSSSISAVLCRRRRHHCRSFPIRLAALAYLSIVLGAVTLQSSRNARKSRTRLSSFFLDLDLAGDWLTFPLLSSTGRLSERISS